MLYLKLVRNKGMAKRDELGQGNNGWGRHCVSAQADNAPGRVDTHPKKHFLGNFEKAKTVVISASRHFPLWAI